MSRFLRIVLPALVILVWLVVAGVGGPVFGKISEVATNDQTSFLPASADATKVQERAADFRQASGAPAIVVLDRDGGLTPDDLAAARRIADTIGERDDVQGTSPVIRARTATPPRSSRH